MIHLSRNRRRGKRVASVAVSAITVLTLGLAATPARADATSAENFWPVGSAAGALDITADTNTAVASDKPDGAGSTVHAAITTTLDAQVVEWWWCNTYPAHQAGAGADPADPSDPGGTGGTFGCTQVGTDTSGTAAGPAAEVYDAQIDAPTAYEDITAAFTPDLVAYVCDNPVTDDAACDAEVEAGVVVDDSTGAASDSSSGEITSPTHGAAVSNNGFTAEFTTSADVTSITACLTYDTATTDPADEGQDSAGDGHPDDCDTPTIHDDAQPDTTTGTASKTWSVAFSATDVVDNTEFGLLVAEGMDDDLTDTDASGANPTSVSGAGFCAGDGQDCLLDQHYLYSEAIQATSVKIAFPDLHDDPDECDEPTSPSTGTFPGTNDEAVEGCIFDQNDNLITDSLHWAFQVTPVDTDVADHPLGFRMDDEGDENDTNSDDFFEQVDGDPTQAGSKADNILHLHTTGTYQVVFCVDSDNNAEDAAAPQSATPCAGEALSSTYTLDVTQAIDHVHVKKQGTEGPLCHTGSSSTTAPAGSTVNLVGCTLGTTGGGTEQGSGGNHVLWTVNPSGNPGDPGQIATQENTSDSAGKADASISSGAGAADKTTTIRFCLDEFPAGSLNGNGICDSIEDTDGDPTTTPPIALQADFQINWQQAAAPDTSDACAKVKAKIRKLKKKIREAKKAGDQAKVRRLRAALRRAKARRARVC